MMQEYGTVTAQIVTSAAQIPIPGATLTITRELPDGRQSDAADRRDALCPCRPARRACGL